MTRILLLATLAVSIGCTGVRQAEEPTGPHFKLLTYNVNWGGPRAELAVNAIRRIDADIVCLQEVNPAWESLLRRELASQYPFMAFAHSKTRAGGGAAFLAKAKGNQVAYIPSETNWFDGWIMRFPTTVGDVQVLNVHLRPPVSDSGSWVSGYLSTGDKRQREIERFFSHLHPTTPVIVAGDFNDDPDSAVVKWLETRGLVNALPQFDRNTETWRWRTSVVTLRRRMDHIVYSEELHCLSAAVIRTEASDHFPVVAVFGSPD